MSGSQFTESSLLQALIAIGSVIGLLRLIWPELSKLVRSIWRDVTSAVIAVRAFRRTIRS
jgi:hypothetical protein